MTGLELNQELARRWIARRQAQNLNRGTARHAKAQLEFFIGGLAAADILGHPASTEILLLLSIGRDVEEGLPDAERGLKK